MGGTKWKTSFGSKMVGSYPLIWYYLLIYFGSFLLVINCQQGFNFQKFWETFLFVWFTICRHLLFTLLFWFVYTVSVLFCFLPSPGFCTRGHFSLFILFSLVQQQVEPVFALCNKGFSKKSGIIFIAHLYTQHLIWWK